jgi:3-hydroxyisobutyrate dehydrogenase-like beta-hydroxyacid dehydrogenase
VAEIAQSCEVALLSLRSSDVAVEVIEQQIAPVAREGQVYIDLGTTRVTETRRLSAVLADRGAALLDAPVSGDPRNPVHIFVGGDPLAFDRAKPVLSALAHPDHLTYGGPSGAGQTLKAVNQLCMGLVPAAYMEAISFATRQGIDAQTVERAVGGDSGWRREMAGVCQRIARGTIQADDIKFAEFPYFLDAARSAGIDMPILEALFSFLDPGPRDWRDNMNRPYVSLWHMLKRDRRWAWGAVQLVCSSTPYSAGIATSRACDAIMVRSDERHLRSILAGTDGERRGEGAPASLACRSGP